jgi:uncharacterized protein
MKTQLVVIQSTSLCNIDCRYCYLPHRSINKRISMETLSKIFQLFFSSPFVSDKVTIVWHAGEPLLLPVSFYEEAFQIIQRWNTSGVHVKNSFQTNAMMITQEWCDFFQKHDVQVGVSMDGPKHIHDANRVDRGGKGTFDRVLRGVTRLRENGIPFSVIAVITKDGLAYPDEIWQFFSNLRPVHLGFNVEEAEGANKRSSLRTEEDIQRYQAFFRRILELASQSQYPIGVREIEALMDHIYYGSSDIHSQTNVPMCILNFDCDGNISTFSPELLAMTHPTYGNFLFGNVFDMETLEEVLTNQQFKIVNTEIQEGVAKCRQTCDYFLLCGGGCPSNKVFENGTFNSTETMACRLRIKAATNATIGYLEQKSMRDETYLRYIRQRGSLMRGVVLLE